MLVRLSFACQLVWCQGVQLTSHNQIAACKGRFVLVDDLDCPTNNNHNQIAAALAGVLLFV